jgi:flagella synthesis protein FlgN
LPNIPANLAVRLNDELNALRAFVVLLESEQQSLLNNETDRLLSIAETKSQTAGKLAEMATARRKNLLADSSDSMEEWLSRHAPASLPTWQNIRQLATQAQHINNINGELIQSGLRHNQQALSALQSASQNAAGLYGPDGQPNLASSGRILGSV